MYFHYFGIIYPRKNEGSFILKKKTRIPYIQGRFVLSLVEIGPVVLEKSRRFLKFVNLHSQFLNYLPLEKGKALHLKKLESPSPKDALYQAWLKLAQWFWRRRFLKFVNVLSPFRNYLPLENEEPFI